MAKEVSDVVVIEGTLSRDLSGNLALSPHETPPTFEQTGYYPGKRQDDKLVEKAIEKGYKVGDTVRYICVLQKV